MKIKIDKFEFTLEEAREVYKQLQELFKKEEYTFPDYPIVPSNPQPTPINPYNPWSTPIIPWIDPHNPWNSPTITYFYL